LFKTLTIFISSLRQSFLSSGIIDLPLVLLINDIRKEVLANEKSVGGDLLFNKSKLVYFVYG